MAELAYLQVTRVCNQKCLFCSNPENGRIADWNDAARFIDDAAARGAAGIIFTGGEPTLFDKLPDIIAYARERGLPSRLITNGQRTARRDYLRGLLSAGLEHMHVSVHSVRAEVQGELTGNPRSLENAWKSLENAGALGLRVDVNTVINSLNADHLSLNVRVLTRRFPFVTHFVWNNIDPSMNRASAHRRLVPRLRDFEVELHRAMNWLDARGRTFRVERVPLCYMSEHAHRSTETRKIVKSETRDILFLDEKGLRHQDLRAWTYGKGPACAACSLNAVCAGLYQLGVYYSADELCPSFESADAVRARVNEESSS